MAPAIMMLCHNNFYDPVKTKLSESQPEARKKEVLITTPATTPVQVKASLSDTFASVFTCAIPKPLFILGHFTFIHFRSF